MFKAAIIAFAISSTTDLASTHYAMKCGAREVVMSQNNVVNSALVAVSVVGVSYVLNKLNVKHKKLAFGLAITGAGAHSFATINNINVANELCK